MAVIDSGIPKYSKAYRKLDFENPFSEAAQVSPRKPPPSSPSPQEAELRLLSKDCQKHVQGLSGMKDAHDSKNLINLLENSTELPSTTIKVVTEELSLTNCIAIREAASKIALTQPVTGTCDAFLREHLCRMLNEKDLLSLPRVQVNVDVSDSNNAEDVWSSDSHAVELVVPAVMKELIKLSSSHHANQFLEERLVNMELMSDLSVAVTESVCRSKTRFSPEKVRNYPCRLHLEMDSTDKLSRTEINSWGIVGTHNLSGFAAVCLINHPRGRMVVNVNLVSQNVICPISPTTGIPYDVRSALISQMAEARSGLGLFPLGQDSLVSVGGFNRGGILPDMEIFSHQANLWVPSGRLTTKRARFSIASGNDSIYAIGGSDGKSELSSVEKFSSSDRTWKPIPSELVTPRSNFGAVELDGQIYAVGGVHYSRPLRTVEVFDPSSQKWKQVAPMSTSRNGVAVVSCNAKIYAIGGQTKSWSCLDTVECYDPVSNKWEAVAPMAMPRRNAAAVTVEDRIYVMGGFNGTSAVDCVEVYNPISGNWSQSVPMAQKRSSASAAYLEGTIYVVGGFTGSIFLNSMEKFDVESEQWSSYVESC